MCEVPPSSLEDLAEYDHSLASDLDASRIAGSRVGSQTGNRMAPYPRGCSETDCDPATPTSEKESADKLGAPAETYWKETNWKKHFEQKFGCQTGNRQAPTPRRCAAPARHALGWLAKGALATCVAFAATAEYATVSEKGKWYKMEEPVSGQLSLHNKCVPPACLARSRRPVR